ncbi:MAG: flagellar hook-length control protein FliK [Burkholderiales bacterium]|nr:flagellar hook-length control protein FliK [Burkholderiales bacterium]
MAASTSNLVLNLTTTNNNQVAVAPSRGNSDQSDQFSATLTQQMQARQAEEASYTSNATVNNTTPAAASNPSPAAGPAPTSSSTTTSNAAQAAAQSSQDDNSNTASASATTTANVGTGTQASSSTSGSSTTGNSGQASHANNKSNNNNQGDDQTTAQQAAVANAQLQVYVAQGLQFAQADADASAKEGGLTKAEGLADMLTGGDGKAHLHLAAGKADVADANDGKASSDKSTDLSAKLDTERQALPAGDAASSRANASFADLLEQRVQSVDASVARQQIATPVIAQRLDNTKSSDGGDPLKAAGTIYEPVGSDGWDHALGNKMVMMVSNDQQEVELQLNPPHLGPMEVKLSLDQNQASVTFVAQHAPVREAIEASMPRLTQMMAESGIQLAQSNVQARSEGSGGQSSGQSNRRGGGVRAIDNQETKVNTGNWRSSLVGGLPGNVNLFV